MAEKSLFEALSEAEKLSIASTEREDINLSKSALEILASAEKSVENALRSPETSEIARKNAFLVR